MITPSVQAFLPFLGKKALFEGRWERRAGDGMPDPEDELAKMLAEMGDIQPKAVYGYFKEGPARADKFTAQFAQVGVVPMQFVTLGDAPEKILADRLDAGKYASYYQYHGLFAELTDALADYVMALMEGELGRKLRRYSFGYPACPDLEGNIEIFTALDAARIGVYINEGLQIEPIYSTAAFAVVA